MTDANDSLRDEPPASIKRDGVFQTILFPARTEDYVVKKSDQGLGLYAARNIQKGEEVFADSLEYTYADVVDGDDILFCDDVVKRDSRRKASDAAIPPRIPSTHDMLVRTHGVDYLRPDPTGVHAGVAVSMLEVPGMLMNHSCDASVVTKGWGIESRAVATRDIARGDELTDNYILHEDEDGDVFECTCGAPNCRKSVNLFEDLSEKEQEGLLEYITDVKRAELEHEKGRGPPVKWEQPAFPPRVASGVPRLVFPGPSCSEAKIAVRQDENGEFGLYALKDFSIGEIVYYFWRQDWPLHDADGKPATVDMVFASVHSPGDPPEGTVVRLDPLECGAAKDRYGTLQFTGWDLLAAHNCEPNMAYNDVDEDEDDNWRAAYAVRDIQSGETLTVDYNSVLWDRGECISAATCHCGAQKCTGTTKGFAHLPPDAREERKLMSWKREPPPYAKGARVTPGEALAPHIRVSWRKDAELREDAPDTDSSSSESDSSSDSESDSSSDSDSDDDAS